MSDDITFDRTFELAPGKAEEVVPGVRRLLANNPSPFTYKGTVSYIIGRGRVAIVDPGPDDAAHVAALLDAGGGAAGRLHERLHGLARQARAPLGADLSAGPWRRRAQRPALRPALYRASQGA